MADDPPEAVPSGCPANLRDLPPEVIGRSARYLDIRDGDLRKLVTIVAGWNRNHDEAMRIIKHTYLKHNVEYLSYVAHECVMPESNVLLRNHLGDMVRHWMEVNDDWRNSIKPYQGIDIPGMFVDAELKPMRDKAVGYNFVTYDRSGHVWFPPEYARMYFSDDEVPFVRDAVVVGVDGRAVSGQHYYDVLSLLDEDLSTPKKLRLMNRFVARILLNPALAIDLGLTEVLRYLLEDVEISVDTQRYEGVAFDRHMILPRLMPLIAHALVHPDPSAFQYLLSVNGIDANPVISAFSNNQQRTTTVLHSLELTEKALKDSQSKLDISRIEALLNRDEVDVDVLDWFHRTPLMCYLQRTPRHRWYDRTNVMAVKVFLDAGASAPIDDLRRLLKGRRGYRGKILSLLEANGREERDRIIASLDRPKRKRDDGDKK